MQGVKILVTVMTVLLVLGIIALVYGLATRGVSVKNTAFNSTLPTHGTVQSLAANDTHLFIAVKKSTATDIYVINSQTGVTVGTVTVPSAAR